ncbi:MAG: MBL fold metallo-hydrolase [Candidatus Poseidoniaceae archaeon]
MLDLHVLGTASARPTTKRAVSGSVLACPEGLVLIDPGEGFQDRFTAARRHLKSESGTPRLRSRRVAAVLLTHGHLDHTWGLLPWMQTSGLDGRDEPLVVAGPVDASTFDHLCEHGFQSTPPEGLPASDVWRQMRVWHDLGATEELLGYPIIWRLGHVASGRWVDVTPDGVIPSTAVWSPEGWTEHRLSPVVSRHSVPSCGWRIDGALSSLVVSGDTASPGLDSEQPGPDLLVHEATYLEEHADRAEAHLHSTAAGAARTALHLGARGLALTHFSARLSDVTPSLSEANAVLEAAVPCVALNDGDRLTVQTDGTVHHLSREEVGWEARLLVEGRR